MCTPMAVIYIKLKIKQSCNKYYSHESEDVLVERGIGLFTD